MDTWKQTYIQRASLKDISTLALLEVYPDSAYIFYTDTHWILGKMITSDDEEVVPDGYILLKEARIFSNLNESTLPRMSKGHIQLAIDKIIAFQQFDEDYL